MPNKRDFWVGKSVQIDVEKAGDWWETRCYSHYLYRVVNVLNPYGLRPLAHLRIIKKLPNKEGRRGIETDDTRGDTVNVYLEHLFFAGTLKNSDVVSLLKKE